MCQIQRNNDDVGEKYSDHDDDVNDDDNNVNGNEDDKVAITMTSTIIMFDRCY